MDISADSLQRDPRLLRVTRLSDRILYLRVGVLILGGDVEEKTKEVASISGLGGKLETSKDEPPVFRSMLTESFSLRAKEAARTKLGESLWSLAYEALQTFHGSTDSPRLLCEVSYLTFLLKEA